MVGLILHRRRTRKQFRPHLDRSHRADPPDSGGQGLLGEDKQRGDCSVREGPGLRLEFHIDETPFDLRSIQGLKPFLDDPFVGQDRNPLGSEEASLSLLNEGGVSRNLALRFDAHLDIDQCVRPSPFGSRDLP
jgi:hypothetical protein